MMSQLMEERRNENVSLNIPSAERISQKEASQLFAQLTQAGHNWESIKANFIMKESDKPQGQKVNLHNMQCLIEYRDLIDFDLYRQAVEILFPPQYYNLSAQVNGDIRYRDNHPEFAAKWYEFIVTARVNAKPTGAMEHESKCLIKINAPGSRNLTSDIDTSIFTRFEHLEHFQWDGANKCIKSKGPDYASRITVAIIDQFYRLSEASFHVTSGEHRDSNAYIDLLTQDEWEYPKFKSDVCNPTVGEAKLFEESEFAKIFGPFKGEKHQWEMAASLFSLYIVLGASKRKQGMLNWLAFKEQVRALLTKELQNNLTVKSEELMAISKKTTADVEAIFKKVEILYEGDVNYLGYYKLVEREKKQIAPDYLKNSPLKGKDLEQDLEIVALNRLYVQYLDQMIDINDELLKLEKTRQGLVQEIAKAYKMVLEREDELKGFKEQPKRFARLITEAEQGCAALRSDYQAKREQLKTNIIQQAQLKVEKLQVRIKAHTFANEAYINRSAVYHVVKGMQQSGEITLSEQMLLASVLQQVGFKLLHTQTLQERGKSIGDVVYLTAKYGERIYYLLFSCSPKKEVDDKAISQGVGRRNTLGILHRLKAEALKSHFHHVFREEELLALNTAMKIITGVKRNSSIPDNQKGAQALAALNASGIQPEAEEALYLAIAAKVWAQVYSSKWERQNHLWDTVSIAQKENQPANHEKAATQAPAAKRARPNEGITATTGSSQTQRDIDAHKSITAKQKTADASNQLQENFKTQDTVDLEQTQGFTPGQKG